MIINVSISQRDLNVDWGFIVYHGGKGMFMVFDDDDDDDDDEEEEEEEENCCPLLTSILFGGESDCE